MNTGLKIKLLLNITLAVNILSNPQPPSPGVPVDPHFNVSCSEIMTIYCVQQLYQTTGYQPVPASKSKNMIAVTGFDEEFANEADLQSFYQDERPDAVGSSFNTVLVNGACDREDLDICIGKSA